jgi:hypothetical protein
MATNGNMDLYRILTREVVNSFGSERRTFDDSPYYESALELVRLGELDQAAAQFSRCLDERGNAWRARSADVLPHDPITTADLRAYQSDDVTVIDDLVARRGDAVYMRLAKVAYDIERANR